MELIDLHLSNRVFNTLKKNNINNLEQLLDIRNNRKFRMTPYLEMEITETLEKFNIKLNNYEITLIDKLNINVRERNHIYRIMNKTGKDILDLSLQDFIDCRNCSITTGKKFFTKLKLINNNFMLQ